MRVVLDANVLISAAISEGPSHRIGQGWLRDQTVELVICDRLLVEVRSSRHHRCLPGDRGIVTRGCHLPVRSPGVCDAIQNFASTSTWIDGLSVGERQAVPLDDPFVGPDPAT